MTLNSLPTSLREDANPFVVNDADPSADQIPLRGTRPSGDGSRSDFSEAVNNTRCVEPVDTLVADEAWSNARAAEPVKPSPLGDAPLGRRCDQAFATAVRHDTTTVASSENVSGGDDGQIAPSRPRGPEVEVLDLGPEEPPPWQHPEIISPAARNRR